MDKNHLDRANHKAVTTEDKIWLPPSYTNNKPPPASPVLKKRGISWGFSKKSVWEWLLLLATLLAALGAIAIPFVVTIIGLNFTQQQAQLSVAASERQHQTDLQIAQQQYQNNITTAKDQQQETALQNYLDRMSDLLLNHKLSTSKPGDEVREVARARTLTVLPQLNSTRKGEVVQFLHESGLIQTGSYVVVDLTNANLSSADLSNINLSGANLSAVDLSGANLNTSYMIGADLSYANLNHADLSCASLGGANLYQADLSYASLTPSPSGITNQQLNSAVTTDAHIDYSDCG